MLFKGAKLFDIDSMSDCIWIREKKCTKMPK